MKLTTILLPFLLISCTNSNPKSNKQTLNFGSFSIEAPSNWTKIKVKGFDSYVGSIAIDSTDTLHFDLGWYSNKLNEDELILLGGITSAAIDTMASLDKYKKNNVLWDTIDGRKAKIVFPKQSGIGTTGIYIDSLWQRGADVDKFNLYGNNLQPANEKQLLQALKTLKFHKK